jgi:hypothetical protein
MIPTSRTAAKTDVDDATAATAFCRAGGVQQWTQTRRGAMAGVGDT